MVQVYLCIYPSIQSIYLNLPSYLSIIMCLSISTVPLAIHPIRDDDSHAFRFWDELTPASISGLDRTYQRRSIL